MKFASNCPKEYLVNFGTCFGKFTASGKFKMHVTALDFLAPYAKVGMSPPKAQYCLCPSHVTVYGLHLTPIIPDSASVIDVAL